MLRGLGRSTAARRAATPTNLLGLGQKLIKIMPEEVILISSKSVPSIYYGPLINSPSLDFNGEIVEYIFVVDGLQLPDILRSEDLFVGLAWPIVSDAALEAAIDVFGVDGKYIKVRNGQEYGVTYNSRYVLAVTWEPSQKIVHVPASLSDACCIVPRSSCECATVRDILGFGLLALDMWLEDFDLRMPDLSRFDRLTVL